MAGHHLTYFVLQESRNPKHGTWRGRGQHYSLQRDGPRFPSQGPVRFLSTVSVAVSPKHHVTQTRLTQETSKTIKTNRCHMFANMAVGCTRGDTPTIPFPTENHACKLFGSLHVSNRLRDPRSVLEGQDLLALLLGRAGQKFQCLIHS